MSSTTKEKNSTVVEEEVVKNKDNEKNPKESERVRKLIDNLFGKRSNKERKVDPRQM